jgi:hypothetical protein
MLKMAMAVLEALLVTPTGCDSAPPHNARSIIAAETLSRLDPADVPLLLDDRRRPTAGAQSTVLWVWLLIVLFNRPSRSRREFPNFPWAMMLLGFLGLSFVGLWRASAGHPVSRLAH